MVSLTYTTMFWLPWVLNAIILLGVSIYVIYKHIVKYHCNKEQKHSTNVATDAFSTSFPTMLSDHEDYNRIARYIAVESFYRNNVRHRGSPDRVFRSMEALNGRNETSSFQSNEMTGERQPQLQQQTQQKVDERRQSKEQTLTNTARSTSTEKGEKQRGWKGSRPYHSAIRPAAIQLAIPVYSDSSVRMRA
ncbi:hypothetical protein WR25_24609 [Diploscapter pachys]|uniref:Uncharacterized protein n=1 Tax=Diploscapter pachys TaxID=2018661 RepID=A0A2A2JBQ2_9BILA|nr:hypothetical protein WR25_24609 [Diploscapter pachys]